MKIQGFFRDVGGASRVSRARLAAFENASPLPVTADPIGDVARTWHPGKLDLVVTDVRPACKTAVTVRFERPDGKQLPPFYAGQYIVLTLPIGSSLVSRPYSISSAPYLARQENGSYVEITVRRSKGDGFVCDYLYDNLKEGDTLTGMMGCGQFYYEPLRDAKHVTALAGGAGITPFASMAKEIANGALDVDLTILYGSVKHTDIVCGAELEAAEAKADAYGAVHSGFKGSVRVVHVMSGDDEWQGEKGFITKELIQKYSEGDTTYMFCGPGAMYKVVCAAMQEMGVTDRRFRHDVMAQPANVKQIPGFPEEQIGKKYQITVVRGIQEDVIDAKADEPVAVALERAAIPVDTHCRGGECGFCRSQLLSGDIFISPLNDGRRREDKEMGWFHACSAYPVSDIRIRIPIL